MPSAAAMTSIKPRQFRPNAASQKTYEQLYRLYRQLHDSFGGVTQTADLGPVMKDLLKIKHSTR